MSLNLERIFLTGATGHIGTRLVQQLIKKGVQTTIYVRNETSVKHLFGEELKSGLLTTAIGDYSTLDKYEKAIQGHTRLFTLLVTDFQKAASMGELKRDLAQIAYKNGVRQIVDLSSTSVRLYGKQGILGYIHAAGEQYLWNLAELNSEQRSLVILRPGFLMTNHLMTDVHFIKKENKIVSCGPSTAMLSWIDPKDIADCASAILTEPINKHDRLVYEMGGEIVNNEQRAALFTKILGRTINYEQISPDEFYKMYTSHKIPHSLAYDFISYGINDGGQIVTPQLSILTGKPLTTLEQWINQNVEQFKH